MQNQIKKCTLDIYNVHELIWVLIFALIDLKKRQVYIGSRFIMEALFEDRISDNMLAKYQRNGADHCCVYLSS